MATGAALELQGGITYAAEALTLNGTGKLTQPSGDVYEGSFTDGIRNGEGRVTYADGSVYEGRFTADQRQGQGKFTGAGGSRTDAFGQGGRTGRGRIVTGCHRIIGADGSLTGYAGGLPRKALLLKLEGAQLPEQKLLGF